MLKVIRHLPNSPGVFIELLSTASGQKLLQIGASFRKIARRFAILILYVWIRASRQ
jgi:hypothetical protein